MADHSPDGGERVGVGVGGGDILRGMHLHSRWRRLGCSCWFWSGVAACASPNVATPELAAAPVAAPEATPEVTPEVTPPPVTPPPLPGRDARSVVACETDADCGWDDPCQPRRCVEPQVSAGCEETLPSPGACLCVAGACTLKPHTPPPPAGTCEPRGCVVDRAGGRCVADDGGVAEPLRSRAAVDVGPSCDCIAPGQGCTFTWFERVPCETVRDCWVSSSPRRHPIARPAHLQKRDFKPCADGEAAPRCSDGMCVVGPAFAC
jgi:hypothetical protein